MREGARTRCLFFCRLVNTGDRVQTAGVSDIGQALGNDTNQKVFIVSHIHIPFGMGDQVDLFAAGLLQDLFHPPLEGPRVFLHGSPAVLTAKKDLGALRSKRIGNPSPIPPIAEPRSVNEQDRISGPASIVLHGAASLRLQPLPVL